MYKTLLDPGYLNCKKKIIHSTQLPCTRRVQVDYCRQQHDESTHFSLYVIRPRSPQDCDIAAVQKEIMEYCLIHRMHVTRWRCGLDPKSAWSGCL